MHREDETLDLAGEIQEGDQLEKELVKINVTRAVLDKLRKEANAFPTPKAGDKAGYEALRRHRLDMVPLRTTTVKVLKTIREEAVAFQKKVIAKEKEITEELMEIEAIDQAKEDSYLAELKAIQDEKDRVEAARVDALIKQLEAFEWQGNKFEVALDTPSEFAARLAKAEESFLLIEAGRKAEAERLEREEQERQAREAAIKAEEERQAKVRAEQEAAAARLKADQEAFEKRQREAKEEADRKERERLAKIAEDERKAREVVEAEKRRLQAELDAKAKAEAEVKAKEEERIRLTALAPDLEKAVEWARSSWQIVSDVPIFIDQNIQAKVDEAVQEIDSILTRIRFLQG